CMIRFREPDVETTLRQCGHVPLPPYIRRGADLPPDAERYQTVYAKHPGAVRWVFFMRQLHKVEPSDGVSSRISSLAPVSLRA
ncbi:MAG: S-adenosylmethionine:tRNA ribosyltransferase-isomerase, partial [Lentisphaeria bacterium]|nr:S-adenosylmethionine:tRNA ribosyltransferase-isomerase [Lentisphaeria bacterium]